MLLAALIIVSAVGLVMLYILMRDHETVASQRLDAAMRGDGLLVSGTELSDSLSLSLYRRLIVPVFRRLVQVTALVASPQLVAATHTRMERAGRYSNHATAVFLIIKAVAIALGVMAVACIVYFYQGLTLKSGLLSVLAMGATLVLPDSVLDALIRQRQNEIRKALADVIDLLAVSTEAGTGLDGALRAVIRRKPGALSVELNRLLFEIRLGKERRQAWSELAQRVNVLELTALIMALEEAEEMGVSIANTLRAQSDALRIKHSLLIRQQAATLALKMLFPLVFCIMPALFIVVLGPGLLSVYRALTILH